MNPIASTLSFIMASGITPSQTNRLKEIGYFGQPASRNHHLSCYGGLAEHSANVTRRLAFFIKAGEGVSGFALKLFYHFNVSLGHGLTAEFFTGSRPCITRKGFYYLVVLKYTQYFFVHFTFPLAA